MHPENGNPFPILIIREAVPVSCHDSEESVKNRNDFQDCMDVPTKQTDWLVTPS